MRTCFALQILALVATLVAQGTAQIPFGPQFPVSQYDTSEGRLLVVHLSAPILARPEVPDVSGSIEVDIIAEDPPSGSGDRQATLGSDYFVNNTGDPQSNTFTVTFQSQQADSSEYEIQIADDQILEGREYFRLRIIAVRIFGSLQEIFSVQDGVDRTSVEVGIEDDDTVEVRWLVSEAISLTEGDTVSLRAEILGTYAIPVAIGVTAIPASGQPAIPGKDFTFTEAKLHFTDIDTNSSISDDQVVIPIIDDNIAEPRESFICNLQGDSVNAVQAVFPSQVTIEIIDNDELVVHWAKDFYEFTEGDLLTEVELVTDSDIEVDQVSISGLPRQIPDGDATEILPLSAPGPSIQGFAINVSIERVRFRGAEYGRAQVTQAGRTDVQSMGNEFVFTPVIKSAFQNLTIVDDDVLEFDELFIAEFTFGPELSNNWKVKMGEPSVLYCLIRDNDFVEVHFNEDSYTVGESEGQVSLSLRITGRFFIPVYAIIEVTDGTATDPEDYSAGTRRFNVTFPQTAYTDQDNPESSVVSHNISITIMDDDIFEDVEYFQARIVETSSASLVKIAKPDTVNVTIIQDKVKAVTITSDKTVLGRVTQTLTLECKAMVNVDDTNVTFTWKKMGNGVVGITTVSSPTNGMATATLDIRSLSIAEHHDQSYECHPRNAIGSGNFTSFKISVEQFPPPNITKFAFQPDNRDAVDIEWLPVDVTGYPDASVEEYVIELARDKDGSDIEGRFNATGDSVSYVIPVKECSMDYWVRIKAVNGDQDVSTFSDRTPLESVKCPMKAVTLTSDKTVLGRVTQTLTLECKAVVNVDDTNVTFTWKKMGNGVVSTKTVFSPTNGTATATLDIRSLSIEDHHDQSYECHPRNAIGSGNFTRFKISVEQFPPPNITKFAFQPDSRDAVDIEWLPVDVTGYPDASVEEYFIELARDKDGSDIEGGFNAKGDDVSYAIPVKDCSMDYWVRIKAVNGDQDVSTFSDRTPLESVNCPVVVPSPGPTAGPHVPPGWAIFLIVFFLLLLCLLCILLLCCILLCCKWNRDPKGVYNAEKREKIYQGMASHSVYGKQECESLERKEKTPEKRPPTPDSVSSV